MAEQVRDVVLEFVKREYLSDDDAESLRGDTPLISGGYVDSFSMVTLRRFLEKRFGIEISDADASPEAFDSVDRIAALVERLRPA